jgi:hypothetical protein
VTIYRTKVIKPGWLVLFCGRPYAGPFATRAEARQYSAWKTNNSERSKIVRATERIVTTLEWKTP